MKRARVLFKFKELLEKNADELARLISLEHGKVHDDALGELARGIDCVDFACGIPQLQPLTPCMASPEALPTHTPVIPPQFQAAEA